MTLPLERNPSTDAQNSISMSQVNVELFFEPNTPISLNQVTVRNLFQKPDDQTIISLWDGFGKSNIGKPKNPQFTLVYQTTARVSWGASDGICNKYTVTVKDAATDSIVYGPIQNFTTIPLQLFANLTGLTAGTSFKVHLLASNTAITPLPTAETIADLLTLENVPETPTTPVVTVISKNILRVTSTATYASSYDIYEVISGTDTLIASSVSIPYNHTVLTYSLHTYKVKGRSTGGVGPMSAAAAPTRSLPDFPIAVSTATCTLITSSSVRVTWSASSSPVVINYRVIATLAVSPFTEVYNSGLVSNLLRSIDPSSTSSPAASFNPATLYTIKVQTINEAGTAETTTSFTTKTAQPAAPTATATSQTAITVTWGTTTGADSYVLYKDGVSLGTKTSPVNDNTGITVYSLHSYQVSAVNVSGESVLSTATSERSWPELPVAVTNVVLTPDMNSIASQWTLAATTSTRTADNYRVYTYLKTNMSTPVDTSALLSSTTNTSNTATQLVGWTQYTIRIYTYNRAGSVYIDTDMTTLADIRPDPLTGSLGSVTSQEPGATNIQLSQITIGTFQPGYNAPGIAISASNGQFQAGTSSLTTGWVSTATIIPDGSGNIVFQARMNASSSETTTVTSTFTIGGGSRTFSVTTRDPNPPTSVIATGGTGTATISWTNLGYTYIVSGGSQSKTVSNVGLVVLGDSASTRISGNITFSVSARNALGGTSSPSTASAYVTPMPLFAHTRSAASVNEGGGFASFGISTSNVSNNSTYNWSISGVSAADFSSMTTSGPNNTFNISPLATSGSFVVYNGVAELIFLMAADHFTEGPETMTFSITGSPTGDFSNGNISMTVGDTSLNPVLIPSPRVGDLPVRVNCDLLSVQDTSVLVRGVEPSWTTIPVSCLSGTIFATGMAGYATSGNATSNSSGEFTLYLRRTASGSYKTAVSMEFSVGGTTQGGWTIVTTTDEVFTVSPTSLTAGTSATLTISGAYASNTFVVDRISSTGYITDANAITSGSVDSNGNWSITVPTVNFGTCQFRVTFSPYGHVRTTGTLTVNPDTTPDAFSLTLSSGYSASPTPSTLTSASTTITGLTPYAPVTVSWSVSGFGTTAVAALGNGSTAVNVPSSGASVTVNSSGAIYILCSLYTSSTWGGANTLSLTVGTRTNSSAFSITNASPDTTPEPTSLVFTSKTAQPTDTYIRSDEILVTGMTGSYSIPVYTSGVSGGPTTSTQVSVYASSVSGQVSTNWGIATSSSPYYATTTSDGKLYVKIMIPSSTAFLTSTTATLYVGTGSASFTVTTLNVRPSTPTISSVTSTAVSISISWSATFTGGVETGWNVIATSSNDTTKSALSLAASTRNYTISGLKHSTSYSIAVTPYNAEGYATSATTTKATTTPTIGTFAWSTNPVANGGSSTFSGSLSGGVGLTGQIDVVATSAGTWSTQVSTALTSDPQTISWTLSAASYTARSDHTYYGAAYFIGIPNYTSGTQVLTVSAPVVPFTGILVSGSISANTPWSYFYTATHTRTYTFTVMGTSVVPFDVVLAVNGTEYDRDQVKNAQNQNIGESVSLDFSAGAVVAISVRGYNPVLAGSLSLQIS